MTRMLLAALALACACSPALSTNLIHHSVYGGTGETLFGLVVGLGLIVLSILLGCHAMLQTTGSRVRNFACVVAGLAIFLAAPAAYAAEAPTPALVLPWGDWLVALAHATVEIMLPIVIPLLAASIIAAIRKVYPWAALFLTQRRVEAMIQSGASYGLNAVQGAAKGKTLSINTGSAVITAGGQYLIDGAPARVIKAAGGPEGIAKRIFRTLDLEEAASVENTLAPAVQRIAAQQR